MLCTEKHKAKVNCHLVQQVKRYVVLSPWCRDAQASVASLVLLPRVTVIPSTWKNEVTG